MNNVVSRYQGSIVFAAVLLMLVMVTPTSAQVYLVKDINPEWPNMGRFDAAPLGTSILFSADDGTHGSELWISDGTSDGTGVGTKLLKDIWLPGTSDPTGDFSSSPENFTTVGSLVYFAAYTGIEIEGTVNRRLFVSDGTAEGTTELDIVPTNDHWAVMGGFLYFVGWDSTSGWEIRKTSGTSVELVKEIGPGTTGSTTADLAVVNFALYGERLEFHASDDTNGLELWSSDGTSVGTDILKDIIPGIGNGWPQQITAFGGKAYFSADDGTGDRELWISDGSESGTLRLKDINSTGSSDPHTFMPAGDLLYFVADDGEHGAELWVSDGNSNGTHLVEDLFEEGGINTQITEHAIFDGTFYFELWHPDSGSRLWVSDGTIDGTHLFFDSDPGAPGGETDVGSPYDLVVASDLLFFTAVDSTTLQRLWVSDGTTDGTHPVAPMTQANGKTLAGSRLFFSAYQDFVGHELHALPLPDIVTAPEKASGPTASNTGIAQTYTTGGSVSLNGNRVQYRFHWGTEGNSDWLDYGVTSASHIWATEDDHIVTAEARAETTGTTSSHSQSLWVQVTFEEIIFDLTLSGRTTGGNGIEYTYTLEGGSNTDHPLEYSVDWNDGSPITWTSFDTGTGSVQAAHSWQNLGDYEVLAKIRCVEHWEDAVNEITLWVSLENENIHSTTLTGPTNGYTDQTYTYTISGESSWGHALEYSVGWGDGSPDIDWTPFPTGTTTVRVSHAWSFEAPDFPVGIGVRCAEHHMENGDDMTVAIENGPAGLVFADSFETGETTQW